MKKIKKIHHFIDINMGKLILFTAVIFFISILAVDLSTDLIIDHDSEKIYNRIESIVEKNKEEILDLISKNLKRDWTIDRISKVNLAILKIAIYEIKFNELPFKVVINEAVELAKKYGDEAAPLFVNGVLASIVN